MGAPYLVSAEELERMPDEPRYELVRGELVPVSPPGAEHGDIAMRLGSALREFVRPRRLGTVFVETGFILRRRPDTVRGPDVSFVTRERLQAMGGRIRGFVKEAPDLAVEIRSPDQPLAELASKTMEYLDAGCALVWLVDPETGTVQVCAQGLPPKLLTALDLLQGGQVLPGFTLPLSELFAEPD